MGISYYIGCLKHESCLNLGKWFFPWDPGQDREESIKRDFYKDNEKEYRKEGQYKQIEIIKEFLKIHKDCEIIGTTDQDRGSEDFKFHNCIEYSVYNEEDLEILKNGIYTNWDDLDNELIENLKEGN